MTCVILDHMLLCLASHTIIFTTVKQNEFTILISFLSNLESLPASGQLMHQQSGREDILLIVPSLKDTLRLNLVNLHQLSYNVEWECLEIVTCLGKEESYLHRDYEQWFHRMFWPPFCVWQGRWIVFPGEGTRLKISFASVLFGQLCMDLFLWMGWIFICVSLLFIMVHFIFLEAMDSQRVC